MDQAHHCPGYAKVAAAMNISVSWNLSNHSKYTFTIRQTAAVKNWKEITPSGIQCFILIKPVNIPSHVLLSTEDFSQYIYVGDFKICVYSCLQTARNTLKMFYKLKLSTTLKKSLPVGFELNAFLSFTPNKIIILYQRMSHSLKCFQTNIYFLSNDFVIPFA